MKPIADKIAEIVRGLYDVETTIELTRPEPQFGDFACSVALKLARDLGKNPREIASDIVARLQEHAEIASAEVAGPGFINIGVADSALLALAAQTPTLIRKDMTVVIETNNPNPFKAMHIGHAFNSIIADSIANLIAVSGAQTYRVSYHGDVGLHVGKSMYALLNYIQGDIAKLLEIDDADKNSFMSRMYAEGSRAYKDDEAAKAQINELAQQSFSREDSLYSQVYDTIFNWSFDQISKTVNRLGNAPTERRFLESEADMRGVKIVRDHVPDVFKESDGALVFEGSKHGSFDNAFVSSNGRGLYAARDLGLMQLKNEQYHPDKSYIVTAEEQRDYFKGVIAAAELALPELKGVTVNLSTGTVKLTTGKMSSRDGDVIEIAWLFDQVSEAIRARGGEATDEVVAGALRYAFLKVRVGSDVVFDINESVSIQGNSGPYLQYAHARACSILRKATATPGDDVAYDASERALLRKISEYSEVVDRASEELLPHHVCTYLYELAQEFNRFYEVSRIIGDEREAIRLGLTQTYRDTLARGLALLGIAAPEKL
jgi:arginyl-tRNA synthetase